MSPNVLASCATAHVEPDVPNVLASCATATSPRLSLCMIVRDCAAVLKPCLASIRPWVDELVVVDTGSKDETPRIAERFGARVSFFPWCDDFSAARNESLRLAQGEWIFWMDSDDTIDEENGRKLRRLADGKHSDTVWGYVMQVHCPASGDRADYTAVDHVKMFRNRPNLRFEGRIHEQILTAIRQTGKDVAWTDIFVVHSGSDYSDDGRRRKYERDLRILHLDIQERPNHPFVLFNLGMTYADMGRHEEAVNYLRRSIEFAQPTESHLRKAYALLAASYDQLGEHKLAWTTCIEGLSRCEDDPELLFRKGMLAHRSGQFQEAEAAYRAALRPRQQRFFSSIDRGIVGAKARHNLACVYLDAGRPDLAEVQWRRVLEEPRMNTAVHEQVIDLLLQQGKLAAAAVEIDNFEHYADALSTMLLKARLTEQRHELSEARGLLETANATFPDDFRATEALGRFHFLYGELPVAIQLLEDCARQEPTNGAILYNLGVAHLRAGNPAEAANRLRKSLAVRPDPKAREVLMHALDALANTSR